MKNKRKIKELGQHFLVNEEILELEAKIADIEGKKVIEIGAGDGRLTQKLLEKKPKEIIAIEIDKKLCEILKKKFSKNKKVKILEKDFLKVNIKKIDRIVGNIPYSQTSKIILKLSKIEFEKAIIMLQKEVGLRMLAKPASSEYGRLSVFCQAYFDIKPVYIVNKENFSPIPKVDSIILKITKKNIKIPENFEKITAAIFSHRLEKLKNAIFHSRKIFGKSKEEIKKIIKKLKNKDKKVFMLELSEIIDLANELEREGVKIV
jgi:16S rRNA (adenine1518-N6/adenine1519-N6)-dimethyltransferase